MTDREPDESAGPGARAGAGVGADTGSGAVSPGDSAAEAEAKIRGHGTAARLFHWATVLLVVVQVPVGVAMLSEPLSDYADPLFILHKGAGSILLVLILLRLLWRVIRRPPPFPDYMPPREKRIAHATHLTLYGLLLLQAGSGYVRTVADNFPIELLNVLGIPPLISDRPELAEIALVVHQFTIIALVALISVHIAAVLRHRLIQRDGILDRMWPPFRRRGGA